jgi:hypothetical protein
MLCCRVTLQTKQSSFFLNSINLLKLKAQIGLHQNFKTRSANNLRSGIQSHARPLGCVPNSQVFGLITVLIFIPFVQSCPRWVQARIAMLLKEISKLVRLTVNEEILWKLIAPSIPPVQSLHVSLALCVVSSLSELFH